MVFGIAVELTTKQFLTLGCDFNSWFLLLLTYGVMNDGFLAWPVTRIFLMLCMLDRLLGLFLID